LNNFFAQSIHQRTRTIPFVYSHKNSSANAFTPDILPKKDPPMQSIEQLLREYSSSQEHGLSSTQVLARQKQYGPNLTVYPKRPWYTLLLRQLLSPFTYLLGAAALISLLVHDAQTAAIIVLIITINTGLSFFQEYRAEQALHILNAYLSLQILVLRDGKKQKIPSTELVPGDIVYLAPQMLIPADLRLLITDGLFIDESVLSGESAPVAKTTDSASEQDTECYLGTLVITGTAQALVTSIGSKTRFGTINTLTTQKKQESHFATTMNSLGKLFFIITIVTALIVILINFLINGTHNFEMTLLFAIALALSMTPEALPLVITIALSHGAAQLAKKQVLVKRLSAIEDLGDITILCTDKTGTLTQNKLVLADYYITSKEYDLLELTSIGAETPSAFEQAAQNHRGTQQNNFTLVQALPFDSKTRTQSFIITDSKTNKKITIIKGALECLIDVHDQKNKELVEWEHRKGLLGQRVIGCTVSQSTRDESRGTLLGLLAFEDPLKETSKDALIKARQLGIDIKIISGDSKVVSGAVAHQIGLIPTPDIVITGEELAPLSAQELEATIRKYAVFARITPEQKYMIVETLKKDNVIGFLGDGINDAPALKAAHVGIVVQEATDLAKSTADIILLKKDLGVIINGIALGRATFANTIKYVKITLAGNTGNVLTLSIVSFISSYLPLLPLQILLVNLLTDFPMIALSTDTVDAHDLRRPCSYNNTDILRTTFIFAIVCSLTDAIFFFIFYQLPAAYVQTYWFIDNIVTDMLFTLSLRTKKIFFKKPYPSKLLLILLTATGIIGVLLPFTFIGKQLFSFVQPPTTAIVALLALSCVYFAITEAVKLVSAHFFNNHTMHKKK